MFALSAASAVRVSGEHDYFDFLRPLLIQHRTDRVLGGAYWLAHNATVSKDEAAMGVIRSLLEGGSTKPAEVVATIPAAI